MLDDADLSTKLKWGGGGGGLRTCSPWLKFGSASETIFTYYDNTFCKSQLRGGEIPWCHPHIIKCILAMLYDRNFLYRVPWRGVDRTPLPFHMKLVNNNLNFRQVLCSWGQIFPGLQLTQVTANVITWTLESEPIQVGVTFSFLACTGWQSEGCT